METDRPKLTHNTATASLNTPRVWPKDVLGPWTGTPEERATPYKVNATRGTRDDLRACRVAERRGERVKRAAIPTQAECLAYLRAQRDVLGVRLSDGPAPAG